MCTSQLGSLLTSLPAKPEAETASSLRENFTNRRIGEGLPQGLESSIWFQEYKSIAFVQIGNCWVELRCFRRTSC